MLELRKVTTEEELKLLAGLAEDIWNECFVSILSQNQIDYMVDKFQSEDAMRRQMINEGYEYYLILNEQEVCGYTGIRNEKNKLFLSKLYLKASSRGKHYATEVFNQLFKMSRDRKLAAVWLTVNRHNEHAIAVYKKVGFVTIRAQVTEIGNGYVMDDYVMEKSLT